MDSELLDLVLPKGVMAQLPSLDEIFLSKVLTITRLGYRWRQSYDRDLVEGCIQPVGEGLANMFLEVPTGLHFTSVHVFIDGKCHLPTASPVEACCETLMKLSFGGASTVNIAIQSSGHVRSGAWAFTLTLSRDLDGREAFD